LRADVDGMDGSQSRFTHPCSLGPRRPCRGTLCSSVHTTHDLADELSVWIAAQEMHSLSLSRDALLFHPCHSRFDLSAGCDVKQVCRFLETVNSLIWKLISTSCCVCLKTKTARQPFVV